MLYAFGSRVLAVKVDACSPAAEEEVAGSTCSTSARWALCRGSEGNTSCSSWLDEISIGGRRPRGLPRGSFVLDGTKGQEYCCLGRTSLDNTKAEAAEIINKRSYCSRDDNHILRNNCHKKEHYYRTKEGRGSSTNHYRGTPSEIYR